MTKRRPAPQIRTTIPAVRAEIRLTNEQYDKARSLGEGVVLFAFMERGETRIETENGNDLFEWRDGNWARMTEQTISGSFDEDRQLLTEKFIDDLLELLDDPSDLSHVWREEEPPEVIARFRRRAAGLGLNFDALVLEKGTDFEARRLLDLENGTDPLPPHEIYIIMEDERQRTEVPRLSRQGLRKTIDQIDQTDFVDTRSYDLSDRVTVVEGDTKRVLKDARPRHISLIQPVLENKA